MVDQFVEGQRAIVQLQRQSVFAEVGGAKNYAAMLSRAANSLSEQEVETYNATVNGRDMDSILQAVKGLKGRYDVSVGSEPRRTLTGKTMRNEPQGFSSMHEMTKAIQDPRYGKDPAYTKAVEKKVFASQAF